MTIEPVAATVVMMSAIRTERDRWTVKGRVIQVGIQVPAERALIGVPITIDHAGPLMPNMSLRPGLLCRVDIPVEQAEQHLDLIGVGHEPYDEPGIVMAGQVRPLAEPCVRVPLSLLRELRGMAPIVDASRHALVHAWSKDRVTGRVSKAELDDQAELGE